MRLVMRGFSLDIQYPFYFCFPSTENKLPIRYGCIKSDCEIVTLDLYNHKDVRISVQQTQKPQTRRIFEILGRVSEDLEQNPREFASRKKLFEDALKLSLSLVMEE